MIRQKFTDCLRRDDGVALILVTLALIPLIGFVGLAIDAGHAFAVESKLIQAVDAAALAGGKIAYREAADIKAEIRRVLNANFPAQTLGATVSIGEPAIDTANGRVTVTANATFSTTFMQIFGQDSVTVAARSVVAASERGMELVLVMDNTGSMYTGGKITAMKNAALDLVDILYGEQEEIANFWVGLVPYTSAVNIGGDHPANGTTVNYGVKRTDWLTTGGKTTVNSWGPSPSKWWGCVEARKNGYDTTDDPPNSEATKFVPFRFETYPDINPYPQLKESVATNTTGNDGRGPNLGCGPSLTPMRALRSEVDAAINAMNSWHRGGTATNLGLVWGWRMLSPNWRSTWAGAGVGAKIMGDEKLPKDYGTANMDKVAVILTDGKNQDFPYPTQPKHSCPKVGKKQFDRPDYSGYGLVGENRLNLADPCDPDLHANALNIRTTQVCNAMKANGIIIYTLTFDAEDAGIEAIFENCASDPKKYFKNTTNEELAKSFKQIAGELRRLRLAE